MVKYLIVICSIFFASVVNASEKPKELGEYDDWTAWTVTENKNLVCYISSIPKKDEGEYTKRGEIYVVVSHRPADKIVGEVSFSAGYPIKKDAPFIITIGKNKFDKNIIDGTTAWVDNDAKVVAAMKSNDNMIVEGTSSKGTKTKDTYSLKGFSKAYKAISEKCN